MKDPTELALRSPEAVELRLPLAHVTARIAAFAVDVAIVVAVTIVLAVAGALASGLSGLVEPIAVVLAGTFLVRQFYFVIFEILWHGSTPGKRMAGLRVVSRDGSGLGVDAVVTRNLLRDVEIFLPLAVIAFPEQLFGDLPSWIWIPAALWIVLVALFPLLTRERLRAGDLAAGTVVVRLPKAALVADEAARTSLPPVHAAQGTIELSAQQLSIYGEKELEILADLIRTIDEGRATASDQARIARTIAAKIRYEGPEPAQEPTRFLQAFYKQQRAALETKLLFGKRKASKHDR